ncbi:MAG: ROK family protein [Tepidisphaeraceae bacterium]
MNSLGIDIGGSSVKLAALRDGDCIWTAQSDSYTRPTLDQLLAAIADGTREHRGDFDAVGLCVPGLMDHARTTVTLAVNMPALVGVRLREFIGQALDGRANWKDLEICNDAIAATTDFTTTHRLPGRVLGLSLGTGVGAAVLDDGVALRVEGESPGHVGMLDVSLDGKPPTGPDGGAGSLEGYIGADALRRTFGQDPAIVLPKLTMSDPPLAALVRAVRICHAMFRPSHVVLLGGIGIRLKPHAPAIHAAVAQRLTSVARPDWTLECGDDDFHAARGAAWIAGKALLESHK